MSATTEEKLDAILRAAKQVARLDGREIEIVEEVDEEEDKEVIE